MALWPQPSLSVPPITVRALFYITSQMYVNGTATTTTASGVPIVLQVSVQTTAATHGGERLLLPAAGVTGTLAWSPNATNSSAFATPCPPAAGMLVCNFSGPVPAPPPPSAPGLTLEVYQRSRSSYVVCDRLCMGDGFVVLHARQRFRGFRLLCAPGWRRGSHPHNPHPADGGAAPTFLLWFTPYLASLGPWGYSLTLQALDFADGVHTPAIFVNATTTFPHPYTAVVPYGQRVVMPITSSSSGITAGGERFSIPAVFVGQAGVAGGKFCPQPN